MSSPPLSQPRDRAGPLKRPARSPAGSHWPQALVQCRKQFRARNFVLASWSSYGGLRQPAASESAVVPSATPGSPSANACLARPRPASSRHILRPTLLRALHCVPSHAEVRAHRAGHGSFNSNGAALSIETGAELSIGPTLNGK
jgi:hypothetical protein